MKTIERNENLNGLSAGTAFSKACRECYDVIMEQMQKVRETILAEARKTFHIQERFLRLAVNEAEGVAWQTMYPQLVFPDLAMEKIQRMLQWSRRQRRIA
jgi:hypothetical protein